jgi:hypothetical protein
VSSGEILRGSTTVGSCAPCGKGGGGFLCVPDELGPESSLEECDGFEPVEGPPSVGRTFGSVATEPRAGLEPVEGLGSTSGRGVD